LIEHDLFGKPVSTFPDHALGGCHGSVTYSRESAFLAGKLPKNVPGMRRAAGSSERARRPREQQRPWLASPPPAELRAIPDAAQRTATPLRRNITIPSKCGTNLA
jgi:hypothetical protein